MYEMYTRDKRQSPRFQVSIQVCDIPSIDSTTVNAHTFDISSTGIGLVLDREIQLGQKMDMCLLMPDNGEVIHVSGKAIWIKISGQNKFRAGIVLEKSDLKPIPLVLRSIQIKTRYFN
jgi:Tfp pilus assembly protein PilZ